MADPILEKAIAKRDAAQREVNKWTNFIDGYRELSPTVTEGSPVPSPAFPSSRLQVIRQLPRPVARDLPPDSELGKTVAVVEAVLNERGRPMPLANLHEAITQKGFVITGDKPRDNLSARLYNSGRFKSYGRATGWWFATRPLPGATAVPPAHGGGEPPSNADPKETSGGGGRLFVSVACAPLRSALDDQATMDQAQGRS